MPRLAFSLIALLLLLSGFQTAAAAPPPPVAERLPTEVLINGVEMRYVAPGWFWYGFENGDSQVSRAGRRPIFRDVKVWLEGYYIAKFEARASDFKRFMESDQVSHRDQYAEGEAKGCGLRRTSGGDYFLVNPERDMPATHLSWNLAEEFTRWMGFRLPTEVEWVKAARGTDKRLWPWGDDFPDDTYAAYAGQGGCDPVPVNAYSKGVSPYGVYNMAGNMFEYVQDWYNVHHYPQLKDGARNPAGPAVGSPINEFPLGMKVLKGGRWASNPSAITIYGKTIKLIDEAFVCYGVRFAVDLETVRQHLAKGTATVTVPGSH